MSRYCSSGFGLCSRLRETMMLSCRLAAAEVRAFRPRTPKKMISVRLWKQTPGPPSLRTLHQMMFVL